MMQKTDWNVFLFTMMNKFINFDEWIMIFWE
jgi:hypothetical protein